MATTVDIANGLSETSPIFRACDYRNCDNEKEYYYEGDEQNYIIAQIDEIFQSSTLISKMR